MAVGCKAKSADLWRLMGIYPTVARLVPMFAGEQALCWNRKIPIGNF
jgi:hypothetical protein